MSLVSEALKKAEREAASREAREKGLPPPLETPLQPYRARRGQRRARGGTVAAAALAAGVVLGGIAFYWTRSTSGGKAAHREGTVKASAVTSPSRTSLSPSPSTDVAAIPASREGAEMPNASPASAEGSPTRAQPVAAPAKSEAAGERANFAPASDPTPKERPAPPSDREATSAGASPLSPKTAREEPPAASAASSEREPERPRTQKSREYVRRIDFPDGSKLELGGIAYSETAPFAYLNGRLLKIGETAAGYALVAIERDRVVVRGPEGELTIRSRPR